MSLLDIPDDMWFHIIFGMMDYPFDMCQLGLPKIYDEIDEYLKIPSTKCIKFFKYYQKLIIKYRFKIDKITKSCQKYRKYNWNIGQISALKYVEYYGHGCWNCIYLTIIASKFKFSAPKCPYCRKRICTDCKSNFKVSIRFIYRYDNIHKQCFLNYKKNNKDVLIRGQNDSIISSLINLRPLKCTAHV